jgi:hypothetical protein
VDKAPLEGNIDVISPDKKLTVKEVIEDVALRSDIVAVIDVEAVEGEFWLHESSINTRISGTVRDLLRVSRNHRVVRGQHIDAHLWFGAAVVENVLVKDGRCSRRSLAVLPYARRVDRCVRIFSDRSFAATSRSSALESVVASGS